MSSDAGGPDATATPSPYFVPAYAQGRPGQRPSPNYAGYPPPGYAPPPMPGPYGYPPPGLPPALKPGVIPLRPLGLSDIFNASIAYVRTNPKATLGLTTIVVVVAQVVALLLQIGPLAATGMLSPTTAGEFGQSDPSQASDSAVIALLLSSAAGIVTTALAGIVLSGLLTAVVGRAVFGATIGIGEAWQRVRGRLLPLLGVTALEAVGATVLIAVAVGVVAVISQIVGGAAAFVAGAVFGLALTALFVYLYTMLSFAPTLIVLERIGVMAAIARSFALVRNGFWRVFGIRLLAVVVAGVVSGAVTAPFSLVGQLVLMVGETTGVMVIAVVLISLGGAVGQIITAPFNAGVVVLLYADRRIRAEAFDLVLQTGARGTVGSTDDLWLTPRH
ncbi:hypothetical protein [Mycolicibacterium hodleri]|nr:hypothetical protein [Mycolicibacterium hodleri]